MARDIQEGELVLVVTNQEKVDVITLGVSDKLVKQKRRVNSPKKHEYLYVSNPLRLIPGKVVVRDVEHLAVNLIDSNRSFDLDNKTLRLYVGKEEVLSYFDGNADFAEHANWIRALAKPYQENMPKVKTAAYLNFSVNQ